MRAVPLSRRRLLQLTGTAGAGLLLGACGSPSNGGAAGAAAAVPELTQAGYDGPPLTLDLWSGFTGGDGPIFRELLDQFNSENDNIRVVMNTIRWREYFQVVPNAVAAGEGPDIGVIGIDTVGTNAARGVITPLDDITDVLGLDEGEFNPNVWNAGLYQGRRFGIPLDVHPYGMFYNRALLEQAGLGADPPLRERADYMAALEALRDAGIQGQWVSSFLFSGGHVFHSLLHQFGGSLFSEDGTRAVWDSEEGVAAMDWMLSLIRDGHSPVDIGQDGELTAFQNGQNAFHWGGIWNVGAFSELPDLDWGVAPLPVIGDDPAVWGGSHHLVVMNQRPDEDKRRAAAVFFEWITRNSLGWAAAGQVPARTSVRESPGFAELEAQAIIGTQLPEVAFVPPFPGVGDAVVFLEEGFQAGILGLSPPQEALSGSARRATEVLEANAQRFAAQPRLPERA